jgi:hypothetical protein
MCGRIITSTSVSSLLQLLTYDSPIDDSVIHTFISSVCATQTEILSLDTNFHRILSSQGWPCANHTFFLHKNSSNYSKKRIKSNFNHSYYYDSYPCSWASLDCPCPSQNQWTRLFFIFRQLEFFAYFRCYSVGLQPSKHLPTNSTWINCHGYTYHPHSNECGPCTLLALVIMSLHPNPSSNILLPFMHPNLAKICRWWAASTTSHATIGLRMDSADDIYIIVWQSGPQGTEDQKLYFKRGALPFLFRVSFCSAIVVCFTLFITAVDHGTQYIFDIIYLNCIISTNVFLKIL